MSLVKITVEDTEEHIDKEYFSKQNHHDKHADIKRHLILANMIEAMIYCNALYKPKSIPE